MKKVIDDWDKVLRDEVAEMKAEYRRRVEEELDRKIRIFDIYQHTFLIAIWFVVVALVMFVWLK